MECGEALRDIDWRKQGTIPRAINPDTVMPDLDSPTDVHKPDPPKLRPSMRGAELHTWYPTHPLPKRQVEADLKAQRAARAQKT